MKVGRNTEGLSDNGMLCMTIMSLHHQSSPTLKSVGSEIMWALNLSITMPRETYLFMVAFLALDTVYSSSTTVDTNSVYTHSTILVNRNTEFNFNTFIIENVCPYIIQ